MITTCPACRTVFRITQEQLDARGGNVRCGRCASVFDARDALQPAEPEGSDRPMDGPPPAYEVPEPIPAEPPAVPNAEHAWRDSTRETPVPALTDSQAKPRARQTPVETDFRFPAVEPERAPRRTGWAAGGILLAFALMTQIAFHYRGEIALLFPEIRPMLTELCAGLACDIPLPHRAELISIESSDLQADPANPSVMVLTATLRNRAVFSQSHPSLELTLTDSQDQPLARRVLGVQDYLGRSTNIDAGFAANTELPVRVYMEASSLKATGYRLYLFFP
jgi:predicted Zn finger-like uncharacterized protein